MIDTLTWRTEGTGYNFTRDDVLCMELGEALFYCHRAKLHMERLAAAHKGSGADEGKEREVDGWAQVEPDDFDEDEDVSVESLLDD